MSSSSSSSSSSPSLDENGQERFLHQGRCRTHCPRGLYPDRGHYVCLACMANCELCTDGNICAKCRERYKLQNGVCQAASCDMGKRRQQSKAGCESPLPLMKLTGFFSLPLLLLVACFQDRCRILIRESALIARWAAKRAPQVSVCCSNNILPCHIKNNINNEPLWLMFAPGTEF